MVAILISHKRDYDIVSQENARLIAYMAGLVGIDWYICHDDSILELKVSLRAVTHE